MSANIDTRTNITTKLDRVPQAKTPLTERDVGDASVLVRVIDGLTRDVARILGLWRPRRLDFTSITLVDSTTERTRLTHGFGGPVRFWIADIGPITAGAWGLVRDEDDSDDNTLSLRSYMDATAVTIRVEEAG